MEHYPGHLLLLLGLGGLAWFSRHGRAKWSFVVKDTLIATEARQVTGVLALVHVLYAIGYFTLLHDAGEPAWGQLQFNLSFLGYWFLLRVEPDDDALVPDTEVSYPRRPPRLPPLVAALIAFGAGHLVFLVQLVAAFL